MVDFPILTTLVGLPLAGALAVLIVPAARQDIAKLLAMVVSVATLGLAALMVWDFEATAKMQFVSDHQLSETLGVRWILGVDGISVFMVVLTALLFPIGFLASSKLARPKSFVFWMLLLEAGVIGVFVSLDLVLFFVFFEIVLVPMYFIILGWGHEHRQYAAMKFFLFTMAGSALLLVSLLTLAFLHAKSGQLTFDWRVLSEWAPKKGSLDSGTAKYLFMGFFFAFAVKVPLFPAHTWLPDAHTEAPTAGSVILAGVLLKMGTYGFLRFSLSLFPQAAADLVWLMLTLATIGIIYGAVVATMQTDLKRLVAYSSVAHLGFVVLGIFSITTQGIQGAVFTMISHGLTTGALFLLLGFMYERKHTYAISSYGGLWKSVPILGGMFCIAVFASVGLPGFSGFVGEFLALLGTFLVHRPWAIISATGVIFAALYLLWAFQRAFTGEPEGENKNLPDLSIRELACVVPLLALSLFLGLNPQPVLDRIEKSSEMIVATVDKNSSYDEPDGPNVVVPEEQTEKGHE